MALRYYICSHCGNIVTKVADHGVPIFCCGEKMQEIIPGTTDAAVEKHLPVVTLAGDRVHVAVGSVAHPMLPEHFIEWITIETTKGTKTRFLEPGEAPEADFVLSDEEFAAAYAYCNLHGLWMK